jgi:hypothetical protein
MTTPDHDLYFAATNYTSADRAYVEGHRFMYGELGERVAAAAILFRDRLLRPGFVLPVIRLAPVAPYGRCMALSGNGGSLAHAGPRGLDNGIWLYLHRLYYEGDDFDETVDETVLHELLHNELRQFDENPAHKSFAWARRCRELSERLGVALRIERPRSVRVADVNGDKKVTTRTPEGCLSYAKLASWPADLLRGGPPLLARAAAEAPLCSIAANYTPVEVTA